MIFEEPRAFAQHRPWAPPTAWLVILCLLVASPLSTGRDVDFSDVPILLPPFWSIAARAGVTGTVVFRLQFKRGKVRRVEAVEVSLDWSRTAAYPVSQDDLSQDLVRRLSAPIEKWTSFVISDYETTLTVILRRDDTLDQNARAYQLEYGSDGIVRKIVMSAAAFHPQQ